MPSFDDLIEHLAPAVEWAVFRARRITAAAVAIILTALLLVWGLGWWSARGKSPLQGRVSVAGRPVTFGTVTVMTADGATLTAPIQPDGTYVLPNVPPGPVRLAVSSPEPQSIFQKAIDATPAAPPPAPRPKGSKGAQGRKPAEGKKSVDESGAPIAVKPDAPPPSSLAPARPEHAGWFRIPGRYANPNRSGLTSTVNPRGTTCDLQLDAAP